MKVQVIVKNLGQCVADGSTIEATVTPNDTAFDFQERIATVTNTLCFPDQQLLYKGQALQGNRRLISGGITDGDVLEFTFRASEETLTKQLSNLIGSKAVSVEELGLLYIHRHLVPLNDALKALGCGGKLKDFLSTQKCFSLSNDIVKLANSAQVQQTASLSPIQEDNSHGPIEVKVSVDVHVPGKAVTSLEPVEDDEMDSVYVQPTELVARAKELISNAQQVPFPDSDLVYENQKLNDAMTLHEAGIINGCLVKLLVRASEESLASQLERLLQERKGLSPTDLGLLYAQRFGAPLSHALRTLALPGNIKRFLQSQSRFSLSGGCVTLAAGPKLVTPPAWQDENEPPLNEEITCQ